MDNAKEVIKTIQFVLAGFFGLISSWLGDLAMPVYILVGCNLIDYITGLAAAGKRGQKISSYTGIVGISKKVCMWVLIFIGWVVDWQLAYAGTGLGMDIKTPMLLAAMVTIWLTCNEVISIMENVGDIGVPLPGFLRKIVETLKSKIEE